MANSYPPRSHKFRSRTSDKHTPAGWHPRARRELGSVRQVTFLSRTLIFVGALLLLLTSPKGDREYAQGSGSCINPVSSQPNCPSGCTGTTFMQVSAQPATNGTFYLDSNGTTQCGTAKEGETCNPPIQYISVGDFDHCCTPLGASGCTGTGRSFLNCCDSSPVVCMGKCCIGNGGSCSPLQPGDCCTGLCLSYNNQCGTCSTLGQPCGNPDDCCYLDGVTCPYGRCCIGKGQPCAEDPDVAMTIAFPAACAQ